MTDPSLPAPDATVPFTPYQKRVVGLLAFLQFSVVLDFMLMAPLGALIMPALAISPTQFGVAVSVYAFSAALSSVLTAGFADRFDRKTLLLFFYTGFVLGTLWCGLANTFEMLLAARIVTGLFGGVIGSVLLAIATDLFPLNARGRVMGVVQSAFAASQVLGIPAGLYLSNHWDWHMPFLAMAGVGMLGGGILAVVLQPVTEHLKLPQERSPWVHLWHTVHSSLHLQAFATTILLATGGFMLMPFSSAYVVRNLGIPLERLPTVYLITGLCTVLAGPLIGRLTDRLGRLPVFSMGTVLSITMVLLYTRLGHVSLWELVAVNVVLFVGIFSRMIPFQALMSSIPPPGERGAFNAINSATQQLGGAVASVLAGHIVGTAADGTLTHIDTIGDVVAGSALFTWGMLFLLQRRKSRAPLSPAVVPGPTHTVHSGSPP